MSKENVNMAIADLHTHSNASDGLNTPKEMAYAVAQKVANTGNIPAAAITDHDTVRNVPAFMASCKDYKVVGVPGVELATTLDAHDTRSPAISDEHREINVCISTAIMILLNSMKNPKLSADLDRLIGQETNLIGVIADIHRLDQPTFKEKYSRYGITWSEDMYKFKGFIEKQFDEYHSDSRFSKSGLIYQAEVLCYYPPDLQSHMEKALNLIKSNSLESGKPTISELMELLGNEIGPQGRDFDKLVFILAHPYTIGETWWGSILAKLHLLEKKTGLKGELDNSLKDKLSLLIKLMKGDISLKMATFEAGFPGIIEHLSGVEVINAAQTVRTNRMVYDQVIGTDEGDFYHGIGPALLADSDAHGDAFLFAGFNGLAIDEKSAVAVLEKIKKGESLPFWGLDLINYPLLGDVSPFAAWLTQSPFTAGPKEGDKGLRKFTKNGLLYARNGIAPRIKQHIVVPDKEYIKDQLVSAGKIAA